MLDGPIAQGCAGARLFEDRRVQVAIFHLLMQREQRLQLSPLLRGAWRIVRAQNQFEALFAVRMHGAQQLKRVHPPILLQGVTSP